MQKIKLTGILSSRIQTCLRDMGDEDPLPWLRDILSPWANKLFKCLRLVRQTSVQYERELFVKRQVLHVLH